MKIILGNLGSIFYYSIGPFSQPRGYWESGDGHKVCDIRIFSKICRPIVNEFFDQTFCNRKISSNFFLITQKRNTPLTLFFSHPSPWAALGALLFWLPRNLYHCFLPWPALVNHFQILSCSAPYRGNFLTPRPICIHSLRILIRKIHTRRWRFLGKCRNSITGILIHYSPQGDQTRWFL